MPFSEIAERVLAKPEPDPITIHLKATRWGRPRCLIGLKLSLMEKIKWQRGSANISLAIGSGDDAGKVRIIRTDGEAAFVLHRLKGGATIDLGYVTEFGQTTGKAKVGCKHLIVDNSTIEIELPKWSDMPDDGAEPPDEDEVDDELTERAPLVKARVNPPVKSPAVPTTGPGVRAAPKAAEPPASKDEKIENLGVVLRIGRNHWSIAHAEKRMTLTERQGLFLRPLVKGFSGIMMIAQVMHSMDTNSSMVASDVFVELDAPIQKIGLKLRFVPKMGYSLNKS